MKKITRAVPQLPCGREMYDPLLPELARRRTMSTVEIRRYLATCQQIRPELLRLQRPSGHGTYWVNYVAWTLAFGVSDGLLEGDKRPSDSSVYRLTELGETAAAKYE